MKITWFSGTGKGGQHRNKHQNCCRVTCPDTGLTATGQSSRYRSVNMREAIETLERRIEEETHTAVPRFRATTERVRTYNTVDNRVVDHASGERCLWSDLDVRIDDLIVARRRAL